jgi:hypothetical protein
MNSNEQFREMLKQLTSGLVLIFSVGVVAFGVIGSVLLLDHSAACISSWLVKRYGEPGALQAQHVFWALCATVVCLILVLSIIYRRTICALWRLLRCAVAPISPEYIRQAVDEGRLPCYYGPLRGRTLLIVLALNLIVIVILRCCGVFR